MAVSIFGNWTDAP
ncbi:hypothetical protein F383_21660 [Gossypium arboreum]|uniref:Uncharacterized protein n=1 Tax=Gossypium arboreum TaxID=29729 RepID=A0A0B0NX01_GOSAR|nr:hypothetical protein F383_21660 [Gossypium arboreum]